MKLFPASASVPTGDSVQIVFIRGFISPSWVSAIGSKYNIGLEFYRRHTDLFPPVLTDMHTVSHHLLVPQITYLHLCEHSSSSQRFRWTGSPVAAVRSTCRAQNIHATSSLGQLMSAVEIPRCANTPLFIRASL